MHQPEKFDQLTSEVPAIEHALRRAAVEHSAAYCPAAQETPRWQRFFRRLRK